MSDGLAYAQMHSHSRCSVNPLSGEGVFHKFIWPLERQVMKAVMRTPEGLLKLAKRRGIDFVAVTDHNMVPKISGVDDFIITSEEWGQTKGHSNFIGLRESIDPECGYFKKTGPERPKDFPAAAMAAKEQRAFVSINHPFKADSWQWGPDSYRLADAIEIWNGSWNEENQRALELWQNLLVSGQRIWCMAGSDFHVNHLFRMDSQVLVLRDVSSKSVLMEKLRRGEFSIARDRESPVVFLGTDLRYRIENYSGKLELRLVSSDREDSVESPEEGGLLERDRYRDFVRLELWEGNSPLSFSNPVFL